MNLGKGLYSEFYRILLRVFAGLEEVPSGYLGQVDFPVRQVTFHSHLPNGQGPRQVICQLNCKKSNLRLAQGKQNLRATCPKGKLEFKFLLSPVFVSTSKAKQVCSKLVWGGGNLYTWHLQKTRARSYWLADRLTD